MIETVIKSILVAGLIMSTMMIPNSPERRIIVPVNGAKPVGPYSPGLLVGDYLYASGQGVRDKDCAMPESLAAQTRQCMENVKAIVVTADAHDGAAVSGRGSLAGLPSAGADLAGCG
jgi:hypothetical protein